MRLPSMGLATPINYALTAGHANLSLSSDGGIIAAVGINPGQTQSANGTATGADGCRLPWSVALTGVTVAVPVSPPVINAVAGNNIVNANEVTDAITGTSAAGATIALTIDANVRNIVASGLGVWSYNPIAGELVAWGQGVKTIRATASLAGVTSAEATRNITIDTIASTVTSVALSGVGAVNGFLNAGDIARFTIVNSKVLFVNTSGGTPRIAHVIGATTVYANYVSGSGSNTLVFERVIQTGDTDANGISVAANSFQNNGGTIIDSAGNAATLTHGALADNGSWKVDTTAPATPTIALGAGVADGASHAEATAGTGVITVSAETGSTVPVTFTRGSNSVVKTITGTGSPVAVVLTTGDLAELGDGTISISAPATDLAGNTGTAATASFVLEADALPVVAIISNDALSRFEITNAASFSGATWTWHRDDGTEISGQNGTSLLYSAVSAGWLVKARANGDAATDSLGYAVPQDNTVWSYDGATSAIANGTDFAGTGGWDGPANQTEYHNGHLRYEGGGWPPPVHKHVMPGSSYSFDAVLDFGGVAGAYNSTIRGIYVNYVDASNTILFDIKGHGFQAKKIVGGVESSLTSFSATPNANGTRFRVDAQVVDGVQYAKFFRGDERIDAGGASGVEITGLTLTNQVAFSYHSAPDAANPTIPFNVASKMTLVAAPDVGLEVASVAFNEPTLAEPVAATVTLTSDYANVQAVILSDDGQSYGEIVSFTGLSTGTPVEIGLPVPDALVEAGSGFLRVRETANPANYLDHPIIDVPVYEPVTETVVGMNIGALVSYSTADMPMDVALRGHWRWYNTSTHAHDYAPTNYEGLVVDPIPAGYDALLFSVFEGRTFDGARVGPYRFALEGGPYTFTPTWGNNATTSNNTGDRIDITPTADVASMAIVITKSGGLTIPPEGFPYPTCFLIGQEREEGQALNQQFAEDWAGVGLRSMKNDQTEHPTANSHSRSERPEFWAKMTHEGVPMIYRTFGVFVDRAYKTDWVTRFAANAHPSAKLGVEELNEQFNNVYGRMRVLAQEKGFTDGHWIEGSLAPGTVVTQEEFNPVTGGPGGATVAGANKTLRVFNTGEVFIYSRSDYQPNLVRVISASPVPIDTTIPASTDANFEVLINSAQAGIIRTVGYRWQLVEQAWTAQMARAILGPDRVVSFYGCDINQPEESRADLLMYQDAYLHVDVCATTAYEGGGISWNDHAGMRNYADQAAFNTWLFGVRRANANALIADRRARKHSFRRAMFNRGAALAAIPHMGTYEGGTHTVFWDVPPEHRAGLLAAYNAARESAAEEGEMYYQNDEWRQKVGGYLFLFQDAERRYWNAGQSGPSGSGLGQIQGFGYLTKQNGVHTDQPAFRALRQLVDDIAAAA